MRAKDFAGFFAAIRRGEMRAAFGTLALSISSILKLALQTAIIPVLARLLGPQAFGLVALATPLVFLATAVADGGLGNALVRKRDSSRELESTVFWMTLGMSVVLAIGLSLFSHPIARLMSAPKLAPILAAMTLILPISGCLSVPNARISRDRKFSLFAMVEMVASIVSSLLAIAAALSGFGPWSLVIQQLTLWTIKLCWLLPASGFRPRLVCRPALAFPFLSFGLNSVGASLADFGAKNFSTLTVGSLIGVAAAGHYAMSYQIIRVPELIISGPLYLSMFVSVARWGDDVAGAMPLALKGLRGVVTLLGPLFCGLALVSDLLVRVVLGPAWTPTGPILSLLAPAGFFLCSFSFIGATLLGLGRSHVQFRLILLSSALLILGTLTGARFGAAGVAAGMSIGSALAAPAYVYFLARQFATPLFALLRELIEPVLATLAMAVILFTLHRHLALRPALELAVLVVAGMASFAMVFAVLSGRRLRDDIEFLVGPRKAKAHETASESAIQGRGSRLVTDEAETF